MTFLHKSLINHANEILVFDARADQNPLLIGRDKKGKGKCFEEVLSCAIV
jgi:hypothetical protein